MAFITFSAINDGISGLDNLQDGDTYIAVFSPLYKHLLQLDAEEKIRKTCSVIYEGPVCYNHFHAERQVPSQFILIFEKKVSAEEQCQPELSPALDVSSKGKTLEVTI